MCRCIERRYIEAGKSKSENCSFSFLLHTVTNSRPGKTALGSYILSVCLLMKGADSEGECNDIIVCLI